MDYEKLGVFYLGREIDHESGATEPTPLLYDSRDLVTHALCVGMTGSGKTGLCVGLLEEAAIDGVPAIVIDPKGDMGNLLLTFPELDAASFRPWVDPDAARREGLSADELAASQAELWRKGLADWDQGPERIRKLKEAADFAIYTPGSSAGLGISIVSSFAAPPPEILRDTDLLRERLGTTVTSVLALLGIDADPVQSREHILLSNLLEAAWRAGRDLRIEDLVREIQSPSISRIGVFEIESFFPAAQRTELALRLNNLLASPGFASWLEGEPLDVGRLLFTAEGKPRISILSIAHLSDPERMFFVSLLLNEVLGWMRRQPGTSSLRAILYMDEIFGFFPPVANPPSKAPLLTLLKQARAFGLGVVLATQNPVDLDYKGLSNIGTWFVGRLQTERDQDRILDGLESATASAAKSLSRSELRSTLSGLEKRTFLLHNVHDDRPEIFRTRWVLSYLRGPLTRDQIRTLTEARGPLPAAAASPSPAPATAAFSAAPRPVLPEGVAERFRPARLRPPAGASLHYAPSLAAGASLYFASARHGVATRDAVRLEVPFRDDDPCWEEATPLGCELDDLDSFPEEETASWAELPAEAARAASYPRWGRHWRDELYRDRRVELLRCPELGLVAEPGESERDFRIRLQLALRERKDAEREKLRKKYDRKLRSLEEKIRKAEQRIEKEKEQASQKKLETAISFGSTLLGAVFGGRRSLGRTRTALRGVSASFKEQSDVRRAEEDLAAGREALEELQRELENEVAALSERLDGVLDTLETVAIRPRKTDIAVDAIALLWTPWWRTAEGELLPAADGR